MWEGGVSREPLASVCSWEERELRARRRMVRLVQLVTELKTEEAVKLQRRQKT